MDTSSSLPIAAVYPDLRVLSYDRRIRGNAEALGILTSSARRSYF